MATQHLLTVISSDPQFYKRAQAVADLFQVNFMTFDTVDALSEKEAIAQKSDVIVISATHSPNETATAGLVQVARYVAPNAYIAVVVAKKVQNEGAAFIKKSGANVVLLEDEYETSSKIEFVFSRKVHGTMIPIKSAELVADKELEMTIHHLMPLNQKIIPFLPKGRILDKEKFEKIQSIGEFYIKREEVDAFQKYIEKNQDKSAKGLKSRCRAQFMNMNVAYKDLVMLISDQSEASSYQAGRELYDKVITLASDLIMSLSAVGDAGDVVNLSGFDDLTAIDRAPAIAASAGLISLMSGIGKPEEVMIAGLMADVGLLEMNPKAIQLMRQRKIDQLKEEDLRDYKNHPTVSLNKALSRKIPIPDHLKVIIQSTHERADRTGFPLQPLGEKIPLESFLIQFCELADQASIIDFGKERPNPIEVRKKIFQEEILNIGQRFTANFLEKIKPYI